MREKGTGMAGQKESRNTKNILIQMSLSHPSLQRAVTEHNVHLIMYHSKVTSVTLVGCQHYSNSHGFCRASLGF